jgi:hypothetical protein
LELGGSLLLPRIEDPPRDATESSSRKLIFKHALNPFCHLFFLLIPILLSPPFSKGIRLFTMSASVAKEEHWALPAEFIALLTRPLEVVLDELVPLPVIRTSKKAQKDAEKQKKEKKKANAFLKAIDSMPSVSGNKTWNGALGHASTGEALLDLFNDLTPGIKGENLFTLLEAAWDVDPEMLVQLLPCVLFTDMDPAHSASSSTHAASTRARASSRASSAAWHGCTRNTPAPCLPTCT